jgi:hypothetical protein
MSERRIKTPRSEVNISKEACEKNIPAGAEEGATTEEERGQNGSIATIPSKRNNQKREISMSRFKRLFD